MNNLNSPPTAENTIRYVTTVSFSDGTQIDIDPRRYPTFDDFVIAVISTYTSGRFTVAVRPS